ncbi:GNAT family N-acetyltransferase [Halorhabdus sp. CBA1104]|uniref:GNAT family N-acetyltransferase n=1 Tax=Halorhabdus sp. CBA1104 TaxID=1380432 RepID=UPI0012B2933E|nr:GNAT family N-acetyltransferase [Halorhabdus sp. CBA1104]QGN07179.1 GNAT family N-acetyltransferase [Halorhabdus sp. CBA1104]
MIRRFQTGDGPGVRRVYHRALADAGTDPADVPGNADLNWVEETYLRSDGAFLIAERDGKIVACGGLLVDGAAAELMRIAVDPAQQNEGLGTAIVDRLEDIATDRGCDRITLTTAGRQIAATEFYPDRGYERVATRETNGYELLDFEKAL